MVDSNQPLYQKIYDHLLEGIKSGAYGGAKRLPSEKELTVEFNVSRITSKKALEMLAENGLIKRMPGKGSFAIGPGESSERAEHDKKHNSNTLIGVIVSDFSESYGTWLLAGIEESASKNGHYIILRRSYGNQNTEEEAIDALLNMGVDGIVIMPVHGEHYNPKILRLVLDGFPIVMIDRQLKGIPAPFVGTDNIDAAKKATDYLLDTGHTRISFLSPPVTDTSVLEDRLEGFIKSHAERGVMIDQSIWITDLTSTMPGNRDNNNIKTEIERIRNHIKENPSITCLFCVEYNIALMATEALKLSGKDIPNDISILCFDGPLNYVGEYFLTHIRQKELEMGESAVRLLEKQIRDKSGNEKILLEADLIKGASTKEYMK